MIQDKVLNIKFVKWDKYGGRILGEVYTHKHKSLANYLIDKKYAKLYLGKAKEIWSKEELLHIINS